MCGTCERNTLPVLLAPGGRDVTGLECSPELAQDVKDITANRADQRLRAGDSKAHPGLIASELPFGQDELVSQHCSGSVESIPGDPQGHTWDVGEELPRLHHS